MPISTSKSQPSAHAKFGVDDVMENSSLAITFFNHGCIRRSELPDELRLQLRTTIIGFGILRQKQEKRKRY